MQKDDKKTKKNDAEGWITYRSELKIVDCTIRDGGLMNDHKFDDKIVKSVYNACVEAGIDYMELGYKTSKKIFAKGEQGTWKFCDEDDIRRIVGDNDTPIKLSVMADAERTDYHTDIIQCDQSPLDIIRIATYIHQIPTTLDMVKDAHDKGYETTVNLMAVSTVPEREIDEALEILAESEVDIVYLVDSFGALYSEQTHYLIQKYLSFMDPAGKTVGMHAHNNQQLAYSNTNEAIIKGANMVDGSLAGLGRGAGNCPLELLVGFLHNPKYKLRPLFQCIQDEIEPMREKLRWGFNIPYMITGILNQHPRTAIAFDKTDDRDDLVKFYNQMIDQD